jgi:hypothetical protein
LRFLGLMSKPWHIPANFLFLSVMFRFQQEPFPELPDSNKSLPGSSGAPVLASLAPEEGPVSHGPRVRLPTLLTHEA